ncbi:head protein [Haloarcula hispanica virus SH1]|uniref:ORF 30 n=1 Tax=Haloarcula hispanica SH1 virus TaxID=326574 RepID=Q4KPF7_9VIRU|nr:head protein [Haloarcula hispanica virus SH1]AAY24956.1 ORF 30 [Haloarcula hispanica virus SH1]
MGKFALASRLADELGSSVDETIRFVDEVGVQPARSMLDEAAQSGSRTVQNWWKPATAVGVVGGGGALAWRQQEIDQARAIANQQKSYTSAAREVMQSDLSPEAKRELVNQLNENGPASGQNKNGGGGDDGGGGLLGGDIQTTLVLLIVVAFALRYTLGDDD